MKTMMKRTEGVVFLLAEESTDPAFDIRQLCPSEVSHVLYNSVSVDSK